MLGFSAGVKSTVKRLLAENGSSSIGGRYIPHLSAAVDQCLRYKSALPEPDSDSYYHSHNVDIPTTNNYNYLPQHILNGAHPPQPKLNIDIGMNGHRKPKLKKKSRKEIFYRHETQAQAQTQTPAVDHLSNILNARVYDVAKETPLQEAKNLSTVSK